MTIERILIVDDELLIRNFLAETLRRKGFETAMAEDGRRALQLLKEKTFDLVVTDMKMPHLSGMELLRKIKETTPSPVVIMMTAYGTVEGAVEAMRLGAFNYLVKPFAPDTIEALIEKAQEHLSLLQENRFLKQEVCLASGARNSTEMIAQSPLMKRILDEVSKVAQSNASVFITGESGTGKEVIARAIHTLSPRSCRSYVRVNCAAIPDTLIESEFFGHEKGAFTGALQKRLGRFELAEGGTLLLDEVTEIPLHLQPKLLRALQEQEFERLGGNKAIKVNVRIVATSNRNMSEAINNKSFREDLYYRLNVVPIHLPPLRERPEDILALAHHFLARLCLENHKPPMELSSPAQKKLLDYSWPGNVRELANVIERAVVLSTESTITADHLYINPLQPTLLSLEEVEKKALIEALSTHQGDLARTAAVLGLSTSSLEDKLKHHQL